MQYTLIYLVLIKLLSLFGERERCLSCDNKCHIRERENRHFNKGNMTSLDYLF